jgi:LacI family transcriptional regulator
MKPSKPIVLYSANRQGTFSREVLRGVLSQQHAGCDWEIWAMPAINEKRHLEAYLDGREVSGVIARGLNQALAEVLLKRSIPLVSIRGSESGSEDFINGPHVDDEAIGRVAGEEFLRLNLGYWGFVNWRGVDWSEARLQSFQSYAAHRGAVSATVSLAADERQSWDGVLKILEWLKGLPKPCGILACNDEAAADVLHACQLGNFSVPSRVAVIGVDNDQLICDSTAPPLSSIDLHAAEVGRAAARQMLGLMEGSEESAPLIRPARMVVRESSHAIDHYLLVYQRASDFMRSNATAGISVSDVARACGVSRRALERAFVQHADSSPARAIREQRIAGILEILRRQPISLERLAQQTGFSDAAGLANFVKRMTGKPPGAFR